MSSWADKRTERPTQVLSLGHARTGSHSMAEALRILGYKDVFHTSVIADDYRAWPWLSQAADDNLSSLPTYTGKRYTKEKWDEYLAPSEAVTDLGPFGKDLIKSYPDAKVILVHRDFDAWYKSWMETLILPSTRFQGKLSGNFFEYLIGSRITQTLWKLYMGGFGVSSMEKVKDKQIARVAYDTYYERLRAMVPPERLLECKLGDGWEPVCKFLDKEVPDQPFPRLNESKIFREKFYALQSASLTLGSIKLLAPVGLGFAGHWAGQWMLRSGRFFEMDKVLGMLGANKSTLPAVYATIGVVIALWLDATVGFV